MKKSFIIALLILGMACIAEGKEEKCRITKYTKYECPNTHNAAGQLPKEGDVAISRDLEKKHKLKFGDLIKIPGLGLFTFMDRTSKRLRGTIDIYENHKGHALKFGVHYTMVEF